jgi:hypothetical protein
MLLEPVTTPWNKWVTHLEAAYFLRQQSRMACSCAVIIRGITVLRSELSRADG